ncbi:hypothetical protein [Salipaludibacillus aurantiacus]|uniref:DUF148 domain-containing protein n=1 Tax=Salipaludibacillus aurantiacus TaxID=1601833 RepID=A0A1H9S3Z7_9BACI|nr:hypothetical protein [Salipaludibacillus aurantiacus]SER79776.1 hypothetical protein SAMN05518684_10417 [Salipaludibacillus aurantiacus]
MKPLLQSASLLVAFFLIISPADFTVEAGGFSKQQLIEELYQLENDAYNAIEDMIHSWEGKEEPGFSDYYRLYKQAKESERKIDERYEAVLTELETKLDGTECDSALVSEIEASYNRKKEEARNRLKAELLSLGLKAFPGVRARFQTFIYKL